MKFESPSFEAEPSFVVTPPPIDALLKVDGRDSYLPYEIIENEERVKQAQLRLQILDIMQSVPTATDTEAQPGTLPDELYTSLTELLNSDNQNNRIVLYLPFEWIPNINQPDNVSENNQLQTEAFIYAYKSAWLSLLSSSEFRADYADGDIPEPEFRNEKLPKVVKAAHLIPELLERGVLTMDEVITLFEEADNATLQNSLADGLYVARERNLITDDQLTKMKSSQTTFVSNTARLIEIEVKQLTETPAEKTGLPSIISTYEGELAEIQKEIKNTPMAEARRAWLMSAEFEKTIEKYASQITEQTDVDALLNSNGLNYVTLGIRSIEYLLRNANNDETHEALTKGYEAVLQNYLTHETQSVRDAAKKTLHHLYSLGLIKDESLSSQGLELPQLNASSETVLSGMGSEIQQFTEATNRMRNNEVLSEHVYPAIVFLGSRMKGYASESADFDVAVFVKPGVAEDNRQMIQAELATAFSGTPAEGGAMEFWLEEKSDGEYTVKNYEVLDEKRGDNTLVHPILGAWCGDNKAIAELQSKLIPQYLFSKDRTIMNVDARSIWLNEIEHTTLKYRLMHKGYSRFSASQLGAPTPHSNLIDGSSAFYDPGYRRLATELFLKKVFLPQLSK